MAWATMCKHNVGNRQSREMSYKHSISKSDNTDKPMVKNKLSNTKDYFLHGSNHDNDKGVSAEITQQLQRDFKDILMEFGALMAHIHCS